MAGAGLAVSAVRTADDLPLAGEAVPGCPCKDTKVSSTTASTSEKEPVKEQELNEVVFVLQKDNKVKMVKVKTDIQDLNFIEVAGVKVGDQVITGPYSIVSKTLKDGSLVKVVTKEKLFEEKK